MSFSTSARLAAACVTLAMLSACGADPSGSEQSADPAAFAAESLAGGPEAPAAGAPAAGDVPATSEEPAELRPTDVPGEPINKFALEVGDCFDLIEDLDNGTPTTITTRLPCTEPHGFEIFLRLDYPAEYPTPYPGDAIVRGFAVESCYRGFKAWVGVEYEVSALDIDVIIPTQENFEDNTARYRGIHCWVERYDGDPMVGSSFESGW